MISFMDVSVAKWKESSIEEKYVESEFGGL